jgi:mono/diheme cytochrome c family protein
MRNRVLALAAVMWLVSAAWSIPLTAGAQAPSPSVAAVAHPSIDYGAVVTKYCVTCHNDRAKTGGLTLEKIDLTNVGAEADVLERVVRKVRVGMMPPQGSPQPDRDARAALVSWLTTSLDQSAGAHPNPGRPLVHRLNRAEYSNAIRDLLALDVDASALLPPDDAAYGFDNIADALGVSPILLERYLAAAGKISSLAVGDPDLGPAGETFRIRQDASQDTHIEGLPVGTVGGILAKTTLPLDGTYDFSIRLFRTNLGVVRGLEYEHQLEYTVDGERVHISKVGGEDDFKANLKNMTKAGDDVEARAHIRIPLKAGPHVISAAFLERTDAINPLRLQPFIRSSNDTLDTIGHPHLDTFTLTGPFDPTGPGDTPSRRRIFVCRPTGQATEEGPASAKASARPRRSSPAIEASEDGCARRIISTLARRAYRGQVGSSDLERLHAFYLAGRKQGTFDTGIQTALQRILASPKFSFRVERDPPDALPGTIYRVSDLELASRLSFFLWSSIPDDQLLRVASQGTLHTPVVLNQQVRRMLADSKAEALVTNFAGQWLYLRNLKSLQPNSLEFPDFDDNLRQALQRETELFFRSILREDRNVVDLMTADYTFLNERLAKHYGVPGVYGSQYRRVTLADDARRGLLGKGAILMVTSHADRTSPVVRGKWVLDNLLSAPVPPMPNNVPPLNEDPNRGGRILTMRERMEEHRKNPVCAACHKIMDPIGLSMENFDAVGAWRTRDGGTLGSPINASGELLDGTKVDGVVTLRQALLAQPELFVGTVAEKMMVYALGRGLAYYDMPEVRRIVRESASQNYRFSSLILGVVNSTAFQKRIKVSSDIENPTIRAAAN